MTEAEWLASEDPRTMAEVATKSARASERTCRLFVAAFWGWQVHRLPAEQQKDLQRRVNFVSEWAEAGKPPRGIRVSESPSVFFSADAAVALSRTVQAPHVGWKTDWQEALRVQSRLLREVFGNPFRPVSLDASWLTSDVLLLAQGIYDDRAFDRMPILADALQDAGCENDAVLDHCRDTSLTHVRGCWVLDLLLNKT